MVAMTVALFGIPVTTLLRFALIAPVVILVLVVLGWLTIGAVQGVLIPETIFGLALYAAYLSPIYLILYGALGGAEFLFRRRTTS